MGKSKSESNLREMAVEPLRRVVSAEDKPAVDRDLNGSEGGWLGEAWAAVKEALTWAWPVPPTHQPLSKVRP